MPIAHRYRPLPKFAALAAALIVSAVVLLLASGASAANTAGYTVSSYQYVDECDDEFAYWRDDDCEEQDDDYNTSPGDSNPDEWEDPEDFEPIMPWPAPPREAFAKLRSNGRTATIPRSAPRRVKSMIKAANSLTRKPYKLGGGHRKWRDRAYDCSGAVSYVLRASRLVKRPMVSGQLARWGKRGKGRWVQVYANKGHVFIVIAGLRFDTSGRGERGPRWRTEPRGVKGFRLRHPSRL